MRRAEAPSLGRRYVKTAATWLIPALLLLPVYLLVLGLSVFIAGEGALMGAFDKIKGNINAALGPLLILAGIGFGVATPIYAADFDGYVTGVFAALVSIGFGIALVREALAKLRG
jgi:hypothetical protein